MAIYTHNEVANSPSLSWIEIDAVITSITDAEVVLTNTDGTLTILMGGGFAGTTGAGGTLTAGSITSAERRDASNTITYETITDFTLAATDFSAALAAAGLQGVASRVLSGADTLNGFSGNDFFKGFAGNDVFNGNGGIDTARYSGPFHSGPIAVTLSAISTVVSGPTDGTDTLNSVEQVIGSNSADTFTATASFNGSFGTFNIFEGRGGNDIISGNGNTRVSYNEAAAGVSVNLSTGVVNGIAPESARSTAAGDLAGIGVDTITGANSVLGSNFDDFIVGNAGDNTLFGQDGIDVLLGGAGADVLDGGAGTDFAGYHNAQTGITVSLANPGINTGPAAGDVYISIEGLIGSNFNDTLIGDNGNNALDGRGGADVLNGGEGFDFARYRSSATGITASLADPSVNTGDAIGDSYISIEGLIGSLFDDVLIGDGGDNFLRGKEGGDILDGGDGSDWADYAEAEAAVLVNLANAAVNTGEAQGDTYISIENVRGTEFGDNLTGDANNNVFIGGRGNDSIAGGGGEDRVILSGNRSDYAVSLGAGGALVLTDLRPGSPDGIDTVSDVELFQFADAIVAAGDLIDDPPIADSDGPYVATEDTPLAVAAADGLLNGDVDPENGPLVAELVSTTAHGTLVLNPDGSFSYQPGADFNGSDSFVYRARDVGGLTSSDVTVQINVEAVNDAAVITGDTSGTIDEDATPNTVSGDLNATDIDTAATFQVRDNGATANGYGTFSIDAAGAWTYTLDNANPVVNALNAGDTLSDSFTVHTADGTSQIVTITINGAGDGTPNQPPIISGPATLTASNEDAARTITAAELLANATDADGDTLTIHNLAASSGTLVDNGNGTWNFTPTANDDTSVTFTYLVSDGISAPVATTATLDLLPVSDAAVIAGARTGSVTEDGTVVASGTLTITDPDPGEASFQAATTAGAFGSLALSATGTWTYTLNNSLPAVQALNAGETLTDTIVVRSADGTSSSIAIIINGANEVISNGNAGGTVNGTAGNDVFDTAGGNDIINAGAGDDVVHAGTGNDQVYGGAGNDIIRGGAGSDLVDGGTGNDTIIATVGDGSDVLLGGSGVDTYDLSQITTSVTVNLGTTLFGNIINGIGTANGSQIGTDALLGIENAIGGSGNDTLNGDNLANMLVGGAGHDTINGRGGNDRIDGGAGNDVLTGGGGPDMFVFKPGFGNDRITDFDANPAGGQDLIDLTAFGIASAAEFAERVKITDIGAHTLVTIDGDPNQTIRLDGIGNATTVTIDDFRYL